MIRMQNKRLAAAKAFLVLSVMSFVIMGLRIYGLYSFYNQQPNLSGSFLQYAFSAALPYLILILILTGCAVLFKKLADKDKAKSSQNNDIKDA